MKRSPAGCLTLLGGVVTVRPSADVRKHRGPIILAAILGVPAWAHAVGLGISLGLVQPADRLSSLADERGAQLLPAPSIGLHAFLPQAIRGGEFEWVGSIDVASFRSNETEGLAALYLPVQAGLVWQAAVVERMALRAILAGGPAFVSVNQGAERSLVMGVATIAWQVKRELRDMALALEAGVSLAWRSEIHELFSVRLVLLSIN